MAVEHPVDAFHADLAHVREKSRNDHHEADCAFANDELTQEKWQARKAEIRETLKLAEAGLRSFYGVED